MVLCCKSLFYSKKSEIPMLFGNVDGILYPVVSFLDSKAIFNLALTCKRCGIADENHRWSLAEELARRLIQESSSESELKALPRYLCPNPCCDCGESWIHLLRELELLRSPLTFDQLIGDRVEYVDRDLTKITSSPPPGSLCDPFEDEWPGYPNTAICSNHVMRSGKHHATFSMKGCREFCYFWPGVVRPIQGWDKLGLKQFSMFDETGHEYLQEERTERWGDSDVHWCTFSQWDGACHWTDFNAESETTMRDGVQWSGVEGFEFDDGELGLLLDLDSGTLTAYKDGRRLGIMKDGLSGEYCWAAIICAHFNSGEFGAEQSIRIKRGKSLLLLPNHESAIPAGETCDCNGAKSVSTNTYTYTYTTAAYLHAAILYHHSSDFFSSCHETSLGHKSCTRYPCNSCSVLGLALLSNISCRYNHRACMS